VQSGLHLRTLVPGGRHGAIILGPVGATFNHHGRRPNFVCINSPGNVGEQVTSLPFEGESSVDDCIIHSVIHVRQATEFHDPIQRPLDSEPANSVIIRPSFLACSSTAHTHPAATYLSA